MRSEYKGLQGRTARIAQICAVQNSNKRGISVSKHESFWP